MYFLCCLFIIALAHAQGNNGKSLRVKNKNPLVKTRVSISPVLGLYFPNKHHTNKARQKMAYSISLKEELRLNKKYTDFIFVGVEYLYHGVNFNSYYFYADSLQLYTPSRLKYTYSLTFHEIDFPLQIKHSFQNESSSILSGYVYAGYNYRWLLASNLNVSESGNQLIDQKEKVTFKSPAFNPYCSSFITFGGGFQKNTPVRHNAVFAEIQFKYALSPMQIKETFAPSSLFVNGHMLYLTVGVKF